MPFLEVYIRSMKNMNDLKKGFSLVEILVVVIITGILAAIAIPRLFSTTAKAKASEVTVANSTYVKMLSAYVNAHGQLGRWSTIGYDAPQSKFFRYDEADFSKEQNTIDITKVSESGKIGWRAVNIDALGSCVVNSRWTILIKKETSGLSYYLGSSSQDCLALVRSTSDETVTGNAATSVAETTVKKSVLTESMSQKSVTEDNKYSLAKAIYSNRDSKNMAGWGVNDGHAEAGKNMKDAYGIEGYVLNSNALNNASVNSLLSAAGASYTKTKVVTELSDVAGDAALTEGIHKGTQTLYYGKESGGTTTLNAYGTRDVYVKVGSDGTVVAYCETETCEDEMTENEMLSANTWVREGDPFNDVSVSQYESSTQTTIKCDPECMEKIIAKQNSWDATTGFDYYTQKGFENNIANIADGSKMKSLIVNDEKSDLKNGDQIRTITQVFNVGEDATPGVVYAGVSGLYYGTVDGLTLYKSRKVYAKMHGVYTATNYKVWDFYEDLDCKKQIGTSANLNDVNFWSK